MKRHANGVPIGHAHHMEGCPLHESAAAACCFCCPKYDDEGSIWPAVGIAVTLGTALYVVLVLVFLVGPPWVW